MFTFIIEVLVFAFSFWAASKLLPQIRMESNWATIPAAFIYIVSYKVLAWILNVVLAVDTLGLLSFLNFLLIPVAAIMAFWLTTKLVDGYSAEGVGSIVWGTIIVTVVAAVVRIFI